MERPLVRRLRNDKDFRDRVTKLVSEYIDLGTRSVDYWAGEFDAAHDILMAYAPLTRSDLEALEKGHPKRFILPVAATQLVTMATFIAQALFGEATPHKVSGRGPEDEGPAEVMNQLLRWNAEQQPTYLLGYLWVLDALTFNRGILYDGWQPLYELKVEAEFVDDPEEVVDGQPVRYTKLRKRRVPVGGFCRLFLVSPYDFVCDPALPLWRLQEHRFVGHATMVPWTELRRRSLLDPSHPDYVLPEAVEALKKDKDQSQTAGVTSSAGPASAASSDKAALVSRSAFERTRVMGSPNQTANKADHGMVKTHEMWIRLVGKDNGIDDEQEPMVWQFLIGNGKHILAMNQAPNQHDMYPYGVGEGRPSGQYQYSPGWALMLKGLQDYIDYFKDRRQRAIARTVGNIFVVDPSAVNITDFLDPDKDGLCITLNPDAGTPDSLDKVIKQVPVQDVTKGFHQEMQDFVGFSENVSGVNSGMQGVPTGDSSATEWSGAQRMGAGRLMGIARMLSVQALVPQTQRIVGNYQQFLEGGMSLRFRDPQGLGAVSLLGNRAIEVSPDVIQGRFDFVPHDGTMPGTDGARVAAIAKLIDLAAVVPDVFTPAPGNIDLRALILQGAKASGLNVENFQFKEQPPTPPADPTAPLPPEAPGGLPLLPVLPEGPGPGRPEAPDNLSLPRTTPLQIRPNHL